MARAFAVIVFLCTSHAAAAGECGARVERALMERLTGELQQGVSGLAAYGESLASRPEANSVEHLVQELIILHERIGRVAMLAEIRDAMRHEGERSLVQFKRGRRGEAARGAGARPGAVRRVRLTDVGRIPRPAAMPAAPA
jgi:hypothetical protein